MGLTLVTGRANSGRTGVVYDVVRQAADSGARPLLLLPTYPDTIRATAELSRGRVLGIGIEQLDGWVEGMWSLYGDGRRPVSGEQRTLLAADAIAGTPLRRLARSATTPGFVRMLSYVAQQVAQSPPSAVQDACPGSAIDAELLAILTAYRARLLAAGLMEPAEMALCLSLDPPAQEGPVVLHRFSDLGRAHEALVVSMSRIADVWITLPWEGGFPATEAVEGLVRRLAPGADRRHCESKNAEGDELARFEEWLYRAPEPRPATGAVTFATAAGAEAEAALIAEHALAASARYGADRVAVVFRDAARHVERLRVAFGGADVPADFDVLTEAARTPYGVALRRLIAAVSGGGRGDLLAFLSSPFAGIDPAVVDELDARWRARRAPDSAKDLGDAARSGPGPGRAIKLARRVCGGPPGPSARANWKELADSLLGAAHTAATLHGDPAAAIDSAAHRALLDVVGRLAELGNARLGAAEVLSALDAARVSPATAERPGHVQVTEAHRLRSRRFDAVIVGGMTASEFSSEGRANAAAQVVDRLLGTTRPSEQALERLLFYDVCTRARRELVLTRQTADSEGTPRRPSVFWEEALDLYRRPDADADSGSGEGPVAEAVRLSDLDRVAPALAPGRARLRTQAFSDRGEGADPRVADARQRAAAHRGELRDPDVLALLAARDEFSATELETYARCPYRWFYERAVRPGGLDVLLDARAYGSLAHRALADFYTDLPARLGTPRVTASNLAEAVELAGAVFDGVVASSGMPEAVTLTQQDDLTRLRRRVTDLVAADLTFLPAFVPVRVELRFGTPDPAHPDVSAIGAADLGGFLLRGSVDRVDESDRGLAVVDYKSGRVPKGADLVPERHLQVGLYAAVVQLLLGRPIVAGLYRSLKGGEARGFYLKDAVVSQGLTSTDGLSDAADIEALIEATLEMARGAADGIRAGSIPARPVSSAACEHCTAASFCGGGR